MACVQWAMQWVCAGPHLCCCHLCLPPLQIVHVLAKEPLEDVVPTAGYSIEKIKMNKMKLTTFDMSGAPKYQSLWQHYYSEAEVGSLASRLYVACVHHRLRLSV